MRSKAQIKATAVTIPSPLLSLTTGRPAKIKIKMAEFVKKQQRHRSKNFYAVAKGHQVAIFTNWFQCEGSINRYKGQAFKGFSTLDGARGYMNEFGIDYPCVIDGPTKYQTVDEFKRAKSSAETIQMLHEENKAERATDFISDEAEKEPIMNDIDNDDSDNDDIAAAMLDNDIINETESEIHSKAEDEDPHSTKVKEVIRSKQANKSDNVSELHSETHSNNAEKEDLHSTKVKEVVKPRQQVANHKCKKDQGDNGSMEKMTLMMENLQSHLVDVLSKNQGAKDTAETQTLRTRLEATKKDLVICREEIKRLLNSKETEIVTNVNKARDEGLDPEIIFASPLIMNTIKRLEDKITNLERNNTKRLDMITETVQAVAITSSKGVDKMSEKINRIAQAMQRVTTTNTDKIHASTEQLSKIARAVKAVVNTSTETCEKLQRYTETLNVIKDSTQVVLKTSAETCEKVQKSTEKLSKIAESVQAESNNGAISQRSERPSTPLPMQRLMTTQIEVIAPEIALNNRYSPLQSQQSGNNEGNMINAANQQWETGENSRNGRPNQVRHPEIESNNRQSLLQLQNRQQHHNNEGNPTNTSNHHSIRENNRNGTRFNQPRRPFITAFRGHMDPLSNFYPTEIIHEGIRFKSAEHLYQYQKAEHHHASDTADRIMQSQNALEAMQIGTTISKSDRWNRFAPENHTTKQGSTMSKFSTGPPKEWGNHNCRSHLRSILGKWIITTSNQANPASRLARVEYTRHYTDGTSR